MVNAAREWLGTPYHHRGSVKGGGCDCAWLIYEPFQKTMGFTLEEFPVYNKDWHLHRNEERYLGVIERAVTLQGIPDISILERGSLFHPLPADIIMIKFGRTYSHSLLVTDWPRVIHAYAGSSIVEEVDILRTPISSRPSRVYSYWKS